MLCPVCEGFPECIGREDCELPEDLKRTDLWDIPEEWSSEP